MFAEEYIVGIERWVEQRPRWTLPLMGQHLAEWSYNQEYHSDSGTRAERENSRKAERYCFPVHTHSCGELPEGVKNQRKGCSCEPCCHEWSISLAELHTKIYASNHRHAVDYVKTQLHRVNFFIWEFREFFSCCTFWATSNIFLPPPPTQEKSQKTVLALMQGFTFNILATNFLASIFL